MGAYMEFCVLKKQLNIMGVNCYKYYNEYYTKYIKFPNVRDISQMIFR